MVLKPSHDGSFLDRHRIPTCVSDTKFENPGVTQLVCYHMIYMVECDKLFFCGQNGADQKSQATLARMVIVTIVGSWVLEIGCT